MIKKLIILTILLIAIFVPSNGQLHKTEKYVENTPHPDKDTEVQMNTTSSEINIDDGETI